MNPGDVRITTRFKPDELTFALFGTIHECGHALYEQNIAQEIAGTTFAQGASYGIHESQSRFWENFIGMSRPFWNRYLPELQKHFPGQLDEVTVDQFYRAINKSEPSLIRIEADELTYNLHIMIRYEIEKRLIAGRIEVKDLPEIWNAKYKEYLGLHRRDGEGVLQDVHCPAALSATSHPIRWGICSVPRSQRRFAGRSASNLDELVEQGEFAPIKDWVAEPSIAMAR